MQDNQRNLIITIVISILILISWTYFFPPTHPEADKTTTISNNTNNSDDNFAHNFDSKSPLKSTAEIIEQTPRISIQTPALTGSINLMGARIDNIMLNKYKETVEPDSANITLLSPAGAQHAYFAEIGYVGDKALGELPSDNSLWHVDGNNQLTPATPVTLTYNNDKGLVFTRNISIDDNYLITFTDTVKNTSSQAVSFKIYGRSTREADAAAESSNYLLHEGLIGLFDNNSLQEVKYKSIKEDKLKKFDSGQDGWLGLTDKYWAVALIPSKQLKYEASFKYNDRGRPFYQADFISTPINLEAGNSISFTNRIFAGAKEVAVVDKYAKQYNIKRFDLLIDWGWFRFFTKPMFWLIDGLYKLTGNFGVAIIFTTILLKLVLFPLANKSYRSMAKMRLLQPQVDALKEKHPDDKQALQRDLMALYKQEKVNPMAGCWPMLIQFPIFFSLYKVLYITIEMRHAPFFGWIQDLAAPDPTSIFNLFGLLPYAVPAFLMIGAWPIIMGITMFLQMRLNPAAADPIQATLLNWLPVIMTYILAGFPAGLVIYWACNNTFTIFQQSFIMRKYGTPVSLIGNIKDMFKRKTKNK